MIKFEIVGKPQMIGILQWNIFRKKKKLQKLQIENFDHKNFNPF